MARKITLILFACVIFNTSFSKETNIAIIVNNKVAEYLGNIIKASNDTDEYNIFCSDSFKNIESTKYNIVIYPDYDTTAIISKSMCRNTKFIKIHDKDSLFRHGNIPYRTAIKNAERTRIIRTSQETKDYISACCIFQAITEKNILGNSYIPDFETREEVIYTLQMCVYEADKNPTSVSDIDENWYLEYFQSQWKGKKVVFLGDSITDSYQLVTDNDLYWHMLEKILGIKAYCYGINGHCMSHILSQANNINEDFDAICIFVGTNDYNSNTPMGEWFREDMKETNYNGQNVTRLHREPIISDSTFKGRTNKVISTLKSKYPTKQIILLTPLHRAYSHLSKTNVQPDENFANQCGLYINDYANAIKEASSIWSVPVIDLFSLTGLNPEIESNSLLFFRNPEEDKKSGFIDRLHPNTKGHIRIAYTMAFQMLALPSSFPEVKINRVP